MVVFFFVFLVLLGIYFLHLDRRAAEREALIKRIASKKDKESQRESFFKKRREKSWVDGIFSLFIDIDRLDAFLSRTKAGLSVEKLLIASTVLAVSLSVFGLIIFKSSFPACLIFIAGFGIPFLYLAYKKKKRDSSVVEQLPDAIDFIVRSLRAGQSVDRAFRGVSANFSDPIGGEISTIYDEISMGIPFVEAMKNFENRFPRLADVKILCSAFIIQRETGGNLTEILKGLSNTIRERFTLKRQVKALSAEGRLTGIILGLLPLFFGGVMYLSNPSYIMLLFDDPIGNKLLFLALILELAGFTSMRYLSRVEV